MKRRIRKIIRNYKNNLSKRLENDNGEQKTPVLTEKEIEYDMSGRVQAISCGGIGLVHNLVNAIGVPGLINERLELLKRNKPYHESDHILNMAYNIICGGTCLEDIELLRNNAAYMDCMDARRIPDPTTAGDFLRRFSGEDISELIDISNEMTRRVWEAALDKDDRESAIIDVDGKIQKTYGECKEGMDMSYKGVWGFSALAVTEATTGVHLAMVNRPGNALSQHDAVKWIDKAIAEAKKTFGSVYLRGDSSFSLTEHFDEWTASGTQFIFGYDRWQNLQKIAENLPKKAWKSLVHKSSRRGKKRKKKMKVKPAVVIRRGYETVTQKNLFVGEFNYRPTKCAKAYRMIAVKKIVDVTEGQAHLFEDARYYFYITNIRTMSAADLVRFIHGRCNHENKIEQLDNGIHALKMPAAEFNANWAYMVIASLAWNIKSYIGLVMPDRTCGREIIAAEFKSFQNRIINIPCQIVHTGRRIIIRLLNYTQWIEALLNTLTAIRQVRIPAT